MTGQDIVDDVRAEFIEPSPTFISQARMLKLINLAQNNYVRITRVLQSFAYTSSVQGQADYPMPTDWLGSEKVFFNDTSGGVDNWRPLEATNIEKMGQESPNFLSNDPTMQGSPKKYYTIGKTLYIFPKPIQNGTNDIFLFYESKPTQLLTLDDPISIDDSLYFGIRAYVLWKLWKQDNEDAKAADEEKNFKEELGQGFKWKNKRILDGRWKIDIQSFAPFTYNRGNYNTGQVNPLNQ